VKLQHPDGTFLASGSGDAFLNMGRLWAAFLRTLQSIAIGTLSLDPDGTLLASGSE